MLPFSGLSSYSRRYTLQTAMRSYMYISRANRLWFSGHGTVMVTLTLFLTAVNSVYGLLGI